MKITKSPAEIIAGALAVFTTGPRGGRARKARWNNEDLQLGGIENGEPAGTETYCALGALSMAAKGDAKYNSTGALGVAADIVAECIPESIRNRGYIKNGKDIPLWNDSLSSSRGFTSIKRTFCKALKVAIERERPVARRKLKSRSAQHAAK